MDYNKLIYFMGINIPLFLTRNITESFKENQRMLCFGNKVYEDKPYNNTNRYFCGKGKARKSEPHSTKSSLGGGRRPTNKCPSSREVAQRYRAKSRISLWENSPWS